MTDSIKKRLKTINGKEVQIFWTLFSSLSFCLIFYVFLLIQIFMNGIESQALVKQIDLVKGEVEQIEYKYLALKNTINVDYASQVGFTRAVNTHFVSLQPVSVALTLNP